MTGRKVIFMLVYDVYIMEHGKNYYEKLHLRGSKKKFDDLHVILSWYKNHLKVIDNFYMFELSPEDAEDEEDDK